MALMKEEGRELCITIYENVFHVYIKFYVRFVSRCPLFMAKHSCTPSFENKLFTVR